MPTIPSSRLSHSFIEAGLTEALLAARQNIRDLGEAGARAVKQNQFGEQALEVDVTSEKLLIDCLSQLRLNVIIRSEEHGEVKVGTGNDYFAVIDGIDGTAQYKIAPQTGRYGTLITLYNSADPTYGDYQCALFMEHAHNRLFRVEKDGKTQLLTFNEAGQVLTRTAIEANASPAFIVETYYEAAQKAFAKLLQNPQRRASLTATAGHHSMFLLGEIGAVLEVTHKTCLELPTMSALAEGAGMICRQLNGESIRGQKVRTFAQPETGRQTHLPLIFASNEQRFRMLQSLALG